MSVIAQALDRALGNKAEVETLKSIALFSCTGLLVSVLLATYGVDLSPGFF